MTVNNSKSLCICYLISSLANEGPTRVLLNTIKNIDVKKFSVVVITLVPEKTNSLYLEFEKTAATIILGAGLDEKSTSFLSRLSSIKQHISSRSIDIVHAHCPRSLIYLFMLRKIVLTVYTAHIFPGVQTVALYGKYKGPLVVWLCNTLIRFIHAPVACSDSVAQEYRDRLGIDMPAVNNGIDAIHSMPTDELKSTFRSKLGFISEYKYILFIGRLSAEKQPYELAIDFLKSKNDRLILVFIGEGPEKYNIEKISAKNIRVDGFQKNIVPYLYACDYYVSSSKTEGLANSMLEAMSVGMPMILSDIPSHRLVCERANGYIGELYNPGCGDEFHEKLKLVMNKDSMIVRQSIRNEFEEKYTAKSMAVGYENFYESIAK